MRRPWNPFSDGGGKHLLGWDNETTRHLGSTEARHEADLKMIERLLPRFEVNSSSASKGHVQEHSSLSAQNRLS